MSHVADERPTGPTPADCVRRAERDVHGLRLELERFEAQLHAIANLAEAGEQALPLTQVGALMRSKADEMDEVARRLHHEAGRLGWRPRVVR